MPGLLTAVPPESASSVGGATAEPARSVPRSAKRVGFLGRCSPEKEKCLALEDIVACVTLPLPAYDVLRVGANGVAEVEDLGR